MLLLHTKSQSSESPETLALVYLFLSKKNTILQILKKVNYFLFRPKQLWNLEARKRVQISSMVFLIIILFTTLIFEKSLLIK